MSAESDLALLIQARTAILTALASNAGKPDYSVDGQTVKYSDLVDRLDKINQQITALQGPFEVATEFR